MAYFDVLEAVASDEESDEKDHEDNTNPVDAADMAGIRAQFCLGS